MQTLVNAQKKPRLLIEKMRPSKDLNSVVAHCNKRWSTQIGPLGELTYRFFTRLRGGRLNDHTITMKDLCSQMKVDASTGALTIYYEVLTTAEVAAEVAGAGQAEPVPAVPGEAIGNVAEAVEADTPVPAVPREAAGDVAEALESEPDVAEALHGS